MITIDRVNADVDVLPQTASGPAAAPPADLVSAVGLDPRARARLRDLVLELLAEHLRELEREGLL